VAHGPIAGRLLYPSRLPRKYIECSATPRETPVHAPNTWPVRFCRFHALGGVTNANVVIPGGIDEGRGKSFQEPAAGEQPVTRQELKARLTDRLNEFTVVEALVNGAKMCAWLLGELEQLWSSEDSEWLPAGQAAARTGYSEDHLRRLARDQVVVAEKRGARWHYLAGSLPRKERREATALSFNASDAANRTLARLGKGDA